MAITSKLKSALAGALSNTATAASINSQSNALTQTQISQMQSALQQSGLTGHQHQVSGWGTTAGQQPTYLGHHASSIGTTGSHNVFLGTSVYALTAEEAKEMESLEEDYNRELKLAKIEYFKSLPVETRQHIVNSILWQREAERIKKIEEEVEAKMSDRYKQLKAKKGYFSSNISSAGWGTINTIYNGTIGAILPFLGGLTQDEVVAAHNDACAEEALTTL